MSFDNGLQDKEMKEGRGERKKEKSIISLTLPVCSIKTTSIQIQARWFFGTLVHHLLGLLALQITLLFIVPKPRLSPDWPVMQ